MRRVPLEAYEGKKAGHGGRKSVRWWTKDPKPQSSEALAQRL